MNKLPPKNKRNEIKDIVLFFLEDFSSFSLPVDVVEMAKSIPNVKLLKYSEFMEERNVTYHFVRTAFSTDDAFTAYDPVRKVYFIIYNDTIHHKMISNRYRWNIAHEIGHVMLGHNEKIHALTLNRTDISDKQYDDFENEADYFAQLLLVPHAVLSGFYINNARNIRALCQISGPASKRRYYEYKQWKSNPNSFEEYDQAIDLFYFNYTYKRKCIKCGANLIQKFGRYCPICGNKNSFQWGDGDKMKYILPETYSNGKLIRCPNCDNEETELDGNYCQICGTFLVNICTYTNCRNALPANARYCNLCGYQSTFFQHDILDTWEEEIARTNVSNAMPWEIDDEPPFQ